MRSQLAPLSVALCVAAAAASAQEIKLNVPSAPAPAPAAMPAAPRAQRVAVVDFARIWNDVPNLRERARGPVAAVEAEEDKLCKAIEAQVKEAKATAENTALRREVRAEAQERALDLLQRLDLTRDFYRRMKSSTEQQQVRKLAGDIGEVIETIAQAGQWDLVLNAASAGREGLPVVLYANPDTADLTDAVIEALKTKAPTPNPGR